MRQQRLQRGCDNVHERGRRHSHPDDVVQQHSRRRHRLDRGVRNPVAVRRAADQAHAPDILRRHRHRVRRLSASFWTILVPFRTCFLALHHRTHADLLYSVPMLFRTLIGALASDVLPGKKPTDRSPARTVTGNNDFYPFMCGNTIPPPDISRVCRPRYRSARAAQCARLVSMLDPVLTGA